MEMFKRLFSAWELCGFAIKNRICVPPLVIYSWSDERGRVTDKHLAHYRALSTGGAGLVIQEATAVCPEGRLTLDQLGIWEDGQIDGLRRIANTLHAAGMPAIVQLSHAGVMGARPNYRVSPSGLPVETGEEVRLSRALTAEEIDRIVQYFIDGACRAAQAGYDGVELHASHGYLLSEFMNAAVNRRTDEYRAADLALLRRIIDGIRAVTPPDFILGARIGAFEPDLSFGVRNACQLEQWGVDFLDVFLGCDWAAQIDMLAGYPFSASIYGAKRIREAVRVPVFAVHRITSGEQAEAVLADTGADMAVIGRGSLVNYSWGEDVRAGRDPGRCLDCAVCQWKIDPEKCPGRLQLERQRKATKA